MSDKKPNASTIEARISVVKACAALELDRQNKFIEETIAHYAAQQITFREQYNQKFFVKLLRKQKPVPTVEERVQELKEEFNSGTYDGMSSVYDCLRRTQTAWYKRLVLLANLHDTSELSTMRLSIEDVDLIEYNDNAPKVEHA